MVFLIIARAEVSALTWLRRFDFVQTANLVVLEISLKEISIEACATYETNGYSMAVSRIAVVVYRRTHLNDIAPAATLVCSGPVETTRDATKKYTTLNAGNINLCSALFSVIIQIPLECTHADSTASTIVVFNTAGLMVALNPLFLAWFDFPPATLATINGTSLPLDESSDDSANSFLPVSSSSYFAEDISAKPSFFGSTWMYKVPLLNSIILQADVQPMLICFPSGGDLQHVPNPAFSILESTTGQTPLSRHYVQQPRGEQGLHQMHSLGENFLLLATPEIQIRSSYLIPFIRPDIKLPLSLSQGLTSLPMTLKLNKMAVVLVTNWIAEGHDELINELIFFPAVDIIIASSPVDRIPRAESKHINLHSQSICVHINLQPVYGLFLYKHCELVHRVLESMKVSFENIVIPTFHDISYNTVDCITDLSSVNEPRLAAVVHPMQSDTQKPVQESCLLSIWLQLTLPKVFTRFHFESSDIIRFSFFLPPTSTTTTVTPIHPYNRQICLMPFASLY